MRCLLLSLLLFTAPSLWAGVAFNNTGTMGVATGVNSFSGSFSVTAGGSNVVAFACIPMDGFSVALASLTVTYGGQTMIPAGAISSNTLNSPYLESQAFYLVNPPTGSNTLSVTVGSGAGTGEIYANLTSFTGADQTTPIRVGSYQSPINNTTTSGGTYSMTVTSDPNDLTVTCMQGGCVAPLDTTNQSRDGDNQFGNCQGEHDHATNGASTVTHTWSNVSSNNLAIVGFSIKTAGASAVAPAPSSQMTINGGAVTVNGGQVIVE